MPTIGVTSELARVRMLVAAAGELAPSPWWRSEFATLAGRAALVRLFPRTASAAALRSVNQVARLAHDRAIGAGHHHLFSLPIAAEAAVSQIKFDLSDVPTTFEACLAALPPPSKGQKAATGPVLVGQPLSALSVERLGATYAAAFVSAHPVYPYFDASS